MGPVKASEARKDFFNIIKRVAKEHQVVHISHPSGSTVLVAETDYDELIETLELLSIPGFRDSIEESMQQIEKGETYSTDEVFEDGQ